MASLSFDAQAITACFDTAFDSRLGENSLDKYLLAAAFDGASVMSGTKSGVVAKFKSRIPHFIFTHAVAHNLQLGVADAWALFDYMDEINEILKDVYAYYAVSAKRLPWGQGRM